MIIFFQTPLDHDWTAYGHDAGGQRYVRETQITKSNVAQLKEAWTFHTGDLSDGNHKPHSAFECTPLYVDGTLYVVSPYNRVFALDPDSGKAKWTFDPQIPKIYVLADEPFVCRGVSTWVDRGGRRVIILATQDARLMEIDSKSGKQIKSFGHSGEINLRRGVGVSYLVNYNETSAPCVIGNTIVVGSSIGDNHAADMPSGIVRAYDAENGKLKWSWDPCASFPIISHGFDAFGDAYIKLRGGNVRTGAGNAWSTISADPKRNLVFVPTGSASPDFCGMLRPGNDADADSVVALDASTGKKVWAFQVVHHDIWDYDVPAQPILADVAGKPAVIVLTKMGHVFVLDRMTGKPLLPVEERAVPTDGVPGEPMSPTQPFPVLPKPLVTDRFEPWSLSDASLKALKERIKDVRQEGIFTPPSVQGTILLPGNIGGCNWSGGCYDPSSNTLFTNTNSIATIVYLMSEEEYVKTDDFHGWDANGMYGTPYGMRRNSLLTPGEIPANKPPWGMLHAVDLSSGKLRWEVPLGVMPQFEDLPRAKDWGSPNLGGSFVTSTGLVFIAATMDKRLRAFDSEKGNVLWEAKLPADGNAAPMTFTSSKTGKQYVVQCAGGRHGLGPSEGDSVVAFALP